LSYLRGRRRGRGASTGIAVAVAAAAVVAAGLIGQVLPAAAAGSVGALCSAAATDDTLRPVPDTLVTTAIQLFGLQAMPAEQIKRSTYYRCSAGRVLLCTVGANLPCGKANASRHLPAADAWCAAHARAKFIPMYVTGHDTIYRWRCTGTKAAIEGQPLHLDSRGFIAEFWKPADALGPRQ
jgi:hypothetical protein